MRRSAAQPVTTLLSTARSGSGRDLATLLGRPDSRQAGISGDDVEASEKHRSHTESLEHAHAVLNDRLEKASEELEAMFAAHNVSGSLLDGARATLDWTARGFAEICQNMSNEHQAVTRGQLKAQAVAADMKLMRARTAGSVQLHNQQATFESVVHRKVEEQVAAITGKEGAELAGLHRQVEEMTREMNALRVHAGTTSDSLARTKDLLRASDSANEKLQYDMEKTAEMLEDALAKLDVKRSADRTLEENVRELVEETERQRMELAAAHSELASALADLGITIQEKGQLADQIAVLVERVTGSSEAAASLQATNEWLARELEVYRAQQAQLEATAGGTAGEIAELRQRRAHLEGEMVRCEHEVDAGLAELSGIPTAVGTAGGQVAGAVDGAGSKEEPLARRIHALRTSSVSRIRDLAVSCEAAERAASQLGARCEALEADLAAALTAQKMAGSTSAEARRWKQAAERSAQVIARCQERLANVIGASSSVSSSSPEAPEAGSRRCVSPATSADGSAAAEGKAPASSTGLPPLPLLLDKLLERYSGVGGSMDRMHAELHGATTTLHALREALQAAEDVGSARLREMHEVHRSERMVLVKTALTSLQQLRTHLIHALSGLREMALRPESQQVRNLAWNPARRCWFVQPNGKVDELTLHLQVPKIHAVGVGPGVGRPRSPLQGIDLMPHSSTNLPPPTAPRPRTASPRVKAYGRCNQAIAFRASELERPTLHWASSKRV